MSTVPPAKPIAPSSAAPQGPASKLIPKGEKIFSEGENSRAMYLLKSGMVRIFKKKGDSAIELDTIRTGQILGELAFLDGNPRSASGEALTDCELLEISGPAFQTTLNTMPEWLKILLKTVVGRLRAASTRIRQLETASTQFDYSDRSGKREAHYIYVPISDILKTATAILLVGTRNGQPNPAGGISLSGALLNRYACQIMQVPTSKVTSILDTFATCGTLRIEADGEAITLLQPDFLEKFIGYVNEENLLEPSKRHDLSPRGFFVMTCIAKYLKNFPENGEGISEVNLATIRKAEAQTLGKEPFRLDELTELIKLGYCTNVELKSSDAALTRVKTKPFMQSYRYQKILTTFHALNEQKRT
jgi:CRP/FNR family cyclic AMP-dependent transcriptional regulator